MGKGQDNERSRCRQWSLWWSAGLDIAPPRDDIFWRTAGSGARARRRTDLGDKVFRGYGDMMAEDPVGQPLIDACTFEFKKGYSDLCLFSCVDSRQKLPLLVQFLKEVEVDAEDAGNEPVLVTQRDHRVPAIAISFRLRAELELWCGEPRMDKWCLTTIGHHVLANAFVIMRLEFFFKWADPKYFLERRIG